MVKKKSIFSMTGHYLHWGRGQKWSAGTASTAVTRQLGPGCRWLQKTEEGRASHAHKVSKMCSGKQRQCEELPAKKKMLWGVRSSSSQASQEHLGSCQRNVPMGSRQLILELAWLPSGLKQCRGTMVGPGNTLPSERKRWIYHGQIKALLQHSF